VDPPRLPSRARLARFAAPAAFLAAVTVAVLLVRAGLSASDEPGATTATPAATTATRATTTRRTTTAATTTAGTTTAGEPRFYTIESGDTFASIAAEFDTTVDRLRELNPEVDPTQLTIGQRIRVE
jgi:LysM repeat protein